MSQCKYCKGDGVLCKNFSDSLFVEIGLACEELLCEPLESAAKLIFLSNAILKKQLPELKEREIVLGALLSTVLSPDRADEKAAKQSAEDLLIKLISKG